MSRPTDQDLEISVANMLRAGVSVSALIVCIGAFLLLRHPWSQVPDYRTFQGGDPALRSLGGTIQGAIDGAPRSVIQCGILVLILTPIARVALCVTGFARQRDRLYVGISSVVLLILLYSLLRSPH